jgi:hypothetical protein
MLADGSFELARPARWPSFVYLWIAVILAGWLKPVWNWLKRKRAADCSPAEGYIESVEVKRPIATLFSGSRSAPYVAELSYSYSTAAGRNAGWYRRDFATEREAYEFVHDLKGKPVVIHYNPHRPSSSWVSESSLGMLLQNRAPLLAAEAYLAGDSVPEWIRPFLWAFVWIAAVGLVASLWVHVGAVMGRRVAPDGLFWILHIGVFIVWFPAVFTAQRVVGSPKRRDFWKVVLKGSPVWMRYMVYGFLGYAFVNFLLFMMNAPTRSNGPNPPAVVWRGFSGHWMAFYSGALAILYSAALRVHSGWRCPNGHFVSKSAKYCERCRQAITWLGD